MAIRLRHEEVRAKTIFERVTGIRLKQHDDGSRRSMVDFIFDQATPDGAVEVTTFTDPRGRQDAYEWAKSQRQTHVDSRLANSWLLNAHEHSTFKNLAAHSVPALLDLEAAGLTQYTDDMQWTPLPASVTAAVQLLAAAGISDARVFASKPPPGQVHITSSGADWAQDADYALGLLEVYIASPGMADVRAKLAATGLSERHAFVWVDQHRFEAEWPIRNHLVPSRGPGLPAEVTHAWFATPHGPGWYWSPSGGWLAF